MFLCMVIPLVILVTETSIDTLFMVQVHDKLLHVIEAIIKIKHVIRAEFLEIHCTSRFTLVVTFLLQLEKRPTPFSMSS